MVGSAAAAPPAPVDVSVDGSTVAAEPSRPRADEHEHEHEVARAAARVAELERGDQCPALTLLAERLGLTTFERNVVLLCVGAELDTRIGALCGRAQGDASRSFPTFALALSLFDDAAWEALSADRPLRYARVIEITQSVGTPFVMSPIRADERIVNYVKGLNQLDDRLAPFFVPVTAGAGAVALAASQAEQAERIGRHLAAAASTSRIPVVHLVGPDASSKQHVALQAGLTLGRHLVRLPVVSLPSTSGDLEQFARLWQRESALLPLALYVDASDGVPEGTSGDSSTAAINRLMTRATSVTFLDAPENWSGLDNDTLTIDVRTPTAREQREQWTSLLGAEHAGVAADLAAQFDLNAILIDRVARSATAPTGNAEHAESVEDAEHAGGELRAQLWDACLASARPRLDVLAERVEPKATWDDLILASESMGLLRLIAEQERHRSTVYDEWGVAERMNRGLGITALFAGESGTGKTMAAEVIASELHLNLYRIDLSAVVSKYIGETEKNLRRLFDAAESGGTILFFDEADALFGKRSEVKESHDRYANIEINYLLQRMEAYRGLAILATNMKSALDTAFVRRLRFVVEFPFPAAPERERIWRHAFGAGVATEELDTGWLARGSLAGGSIHNIAIDATFGAAAHGGVVTMPLVIEAIRREYRKQGRSVNEAELRWTAAAMPASSVPEPAPVALEVVQ